MEKVVMYAVMCKIDVVADAPSTAAPGQKSGNWAQNESNFESFLLLCWPPQALPS